MEQQIPKEKQMIKDIKREAGSRSHRIFAKVIDHVLRHPWIYIAASFILTILAAITIVFRFDIKSDIKDMMPQDARSVEDMYTIADRMGSIQTLTVYLKTPKLEPLSEELHQSQAYKDCVSSLGDGEHLLRDDPPVGENWCDNGLMLYARAYVDKVKLLESVGNIRFIQDKTFFENNLLLYATADELNKVYDEIDKSLTEARRQSGEYKACLLTESDPAACDSLKPSMKNTETGANVQNAGEDSTDRFKQMLVDRYKQTELAYVKEFPFYPMANGAWLVSLELRFRNSTTSLQSVNDAIKEINGLTKDIDQKALGSNVEVEYGGGLNDMKSEYSAIITNITTSISLTIFSILALIAIFFRSVRVSFRIFGPLVMSTLWSLGITFGTVGYLNMITAFIFAVLIGLGIDFGIHLYSRYMLERRGGSDVESALKTAVVETGTPIFFGALTTAAAFYTLMFGSFPGFSQFGFVAGTGVMLAFITMATVMPAMVLVMERAWPTKIPEVKTKTFTLAQSQRAMPLLLAVSLMMLAGVGYAVSQLPSIQFEDNYYHLKLREETTENPTADAEFFAKDQSRHSSPVIAVLNNTDEVLTLDLILKKNREYAGFQQYRKLMMDMPNTFRRIVSPFAEAMPYLGQPRSLPMVSALSRLLPPGHQDILPLFANYGSEKSKSMKLYRHFAQSMPAAAERISGLFPEALVANDEASYLRTVVLMQHILPRSTWEFIPTQVPSGQYNAISNFASIFSYIPGTDSQQAERLAAIERIEARTADRNIRFLPTEEREKIVSLRPYLVKTPVHVDALPEWVKLQFKENGMHPLPPRPESGVDYAFGNIAVLYQATSTYDGAQAQMLADDVRSLRVEGHPVTAATGALVYADMLRLVRTDGMEISLVALLVILVISVVQQRNAVSALVVTLPVLSGIALSLFIMIQCDLKLGIFNIVMLPVLMGIGIDGSIYLLQRYQMLGRGSILQAVRAVLPPVFMSSATTLVGFGGMVLSRHMGLNTMGQLAIIGITVCFFSTFLILPGLVCIAEKFKCRGLVPEFEYDPNGHSEQA